MPDFLPRRQADVIAWSKAALNTLVQWPGDFGVSIEQVEQYQLLVDQAFAAFTAATTAETRTSPSVARKNTALDELRAGTRTLMAIVRATPGLSAGTLARLNLSPRDDNPSRIAAPATPPELFILSTTDNTVRVQLVDADSPSRRAKPAGVAGAAVFACEGADGDEPPPPSAPWRFMATVTRTRFEITFGPEVPRFATVWLAASWYNPRGQHSRRSTPKCTHLLGGTPHFQQLNAA